MTHLSSQVVELLQNSMPSRYDDLTASQAFLKATVAVFDLTADLHRHHGAVRDFMRELLSSVTQSVSGHALSGLQGLDFNIGSTWQWQTKHAGAPRLGEDCFCPWACPGWHCSGVWQWRGKHAGAHEVFSLVAVLGPVTGMHIQNTRSSFRNGRPSSASSECCFQRPQSSS